MKDRIVYPPRGSPDAPARSQATLDAEARLAGVIAHDFNNLISVIRGYSEMLLEDIPGPNSQHSMLSEISKACQRAGALTQKLVAFAGREARRPELLDPRRFLAELDSRLRERLGARVELALSVAPDAWTVKVDRQQFETVLLNLAENAREAMPTGGKLTIAACNLPAGSGMLAEDALRITLADTGRGVDVAIRGRIFEPFFSTKPRAIGIGLGLTTAYGIVRAHGGQIELSGEPGPGAEFHVDLPRAE